MPALPGETLLSTVFADVHYYLGDPTAKPPHDRFAKVSYVYLYQNAAQQRGKLEVANHAGTPEQDAFNGYLDASNFRYSHNQPNLLTITVGEDRDQRDSNQWHLPSFDERNEKKYLYRLHTLDVYFWTAPDAQAFLAHLKTVISAQQIEELDVPQKLAMASPIEHKDSMSPVVQQLEKTAIGAQFPPRAESTSTAQSLPGPPTPATSAGADRTPPPIMAYNPAAPPAPEPIAHREKTPPPPDAETGTGLTAAASHDHVPQYQQQYQQASQQPLFFSGPPQASAQRTPSVTAFSGPPQAQRTHSGSFPPPPPASAPKAPSPEPGYVTPSFGPAHTSSPQQQAFHRQSSYQPGLPAQYASYPQQQQYANYPQSPGFPSQQPPTPSNPPAYNTHTPLASPGLPPPPASAPPQQQTFGYSGYNYAAQTGSYVPPQALAQGNNMYDVHQQVYRPTEAEAAHGHGARAKPKLGRDHSGRGKVEDKVEKMEKGVNRFFKSFDSKW